MYYSVRDGLEFDSVDIRFGGVSSRNGRVVEFADEKDVLLVYRAFFQVGSPPMDRIQAQLVHLYVPKPQYSKLFALVGN